MLVLSFISLLLFLPSLTAFSVTPTMTTSTAATGKFHFCIDRGGTFTDIHSILPDGRQVVRKLLSEDPSDYADAPTEGIRRVLQEHWYCWTGLSTWQAH